MAKHQVTLADERPMYRNVRNNLRKRYPANQGWEIFGPDDRRKQGYRPDFVVERSVNGITEKIIVEVKDEMRITADHVSQLNTYVRNHAGGSVRIIDKILVHPAGANTDAAPSDIIKMAIRSAQ